MEHHHALVVSQLWRVLGLLVLLLAAGLRWRNQLYWNTAVMFLVNAWIWSLLQVGLNLCCVTFWSTIVLILLHIVRLWGHQVHVRGPWLSLGRHNVGLACYRVIAVTNVLVVGQLVAESLVLYLFIIMIRNVVTICSIGMFVAVQMLKVFIELHRNYRILALIATGALGNSNVSGHGLINEVVHHFAVW